MQIYGIIVEYRERNVKVFFSTRKKSWDLLLLKISFLSRFKYFWGHFYENIFIRINVFLQCFGKILDEKCRALRSFSKKMGSVQINIAYGIFLSRFSHLSLKFHPAPTLAESPRMIIFSTSIRARFSQWVQRVTLSFSIITEYMRGKKGRPSSLSNNAPGIHK